MWKNLVMKKGLVSILLCTYNAQETIVQTLQSCLNQTYQNFEILIHDDGSIDETLVAIQKINDSRIQVLNSWKKLGPYRWLNFLLDHAKGEYIAIQDHDDLREPKKLEFQIQFLDKNTDYIWCGTKTRMRYEGDSKYFDYFLWEKNYYTLHPSLMFRNQGFRYPEDKVYMNDAWFQKEVLCKWKKKIKNLDQMLTIHRIKEGTKNYSYKRFSLNRENLHTLYHLHSWRYATAALGIEIMRKILYPFLQKIGQGSIIDKIERFPFILQGYCIETL